MNAPDKGIPLTMPPLEAGHGAGPAASAAPDPAVKAVPPEPRLGDILRRTRGLTPEQVEQALALQARQRIRFGEALVKLGFVAPEDVMRAVSQQFHFPYAGTAGPQLSHELVLARSPFDRDVEVFRDLRTQLLLGGFGAPDNHTALAIVSADRGDGKTFLAANLAVAFGQMPGRTLLVDADLRAARLHKVFRCDQGAGLADVLSGRADLRVAVPVAGMPNLHLLPAGTMPPNPSELFLETAFVRLLGELTARFDYVIFDTPAAAHGSDARVIASRCGMAMGVARRNRSRLPELQVFLDQILKSGVALAGVLMNRF